MRRAPRFVFYLAVALVWLAALGGGLELFERVNLRRVERRADEYGEPLMQAAFADDDAVIQATAPQAPPPPPEVRRELPAREQLASLDEAGRSKLAAERRELILVCDREGRILSAYSASGPEAAEGPIAELARLLRPGAAVTEALPSAAAEDARRAIEGVFDGGFHPPREYTVPLPGGDSFCAEVSFAPVQQDADSASLVAVFIRGSMWKVMWTSFREYVHGNNFYDRWPKSEFWTNGLGFRDDEVAVPKPAGVYRIACIGGSTTVEGPRNDLTYPNMLERRLREHFRTDAIEVVNCGVYTLDTGREVQRFPDYLALEPDLIIQYNFVNDLMAGLPNWMTPTGIRSDAGKALKAVLRKSAFLHRRFNWWLLPSERELTRRIDEMVIANLRREHQMAEEAGVAMAIASFAGPDVANLDPRERDYFYCRSYRLWGASVDTRSYARMVDIYNRLVRQLCESEGILYVPVAEHVKGGVDLFTDICHMHLNAMQMKADVVFETIKDQVGVAVRTGQAGAG